MRLDVRAVEKDHAQGWIPVFHLLQECLPHTELRPANEQLSCGPSGAELRRKRSPFRAVLVTPEHRRYRQAQVAWRCCFAFGSLRLDQSSQTRHVSSEITDCIMLIIKSYADLLHLQDLIGPSLPAVLHSNPTDDSS